MAACQFQFLMGILVVVQRTLEFQVAHLVPGYHPWLVVVKDVSKFLHGGAAFSAA